MPLKVNLTKLPDITNDSFYPLYDCESRTLVLYGGAGSGKSKFAAQKLIYRIITEQNHKILVLRKVGETLRESVFSLIIETIMEFGIYSFCKATVSPMQISFPIFNSVIIFKGLDDQEKVKSITSITSMWLEETTEFLEDDYNQLDLRLRGQTNNYKQIILSFNPIEPSHWLKTRFFDNKEDDCTVVKSTYLDNQFLDDKYIARLINLKKKDYFFYQVYALGEWGILKGKIFNNYKVEDFSDIENTFDNIRCGLDWGFADDPLAFVKMHYDKTRMRLYIIDELYLYGYTNNKSFPLIQQKSNGVQITADSAEPKSIQEAKNAGLFMQGAKKGQGSVEHGIKFLQSLEIIIHPRCINTKVEFDKYKYKQNKNGVTVPEPVDMDNHIIDAMRYAMESDSTGDNSSGFA